MKRIPQYIALVTLCLFVYGVSHAQSVNPPTTTTTTTPTVPPDALPNDYATTTLGGKKNYVRTYVPKKANTNSSTVNMNAPITEVQTSTVYYDGLGRPLQEVSKSALGPAKDLVLTHIYDNVGREAKQYLPFKNMGNGKFVHDAFSKQDQFYSTQPFPAMGTYANEGIRYTKRYYDNSPVNRVIKVEKPGNAWGGSQRGVQSSLASNVAGQVRLWKLNASGLPHTSSTYATNQLYKSITQDEDGGQVEEYKDKVGRALLSRQKKDASTYLETYRVYNDFGQLRYILPPLAVEHLQSNNWAVSQDVLDELCNQYEYDARGRVIAKKLAGKAWDYMIYDNRDRVVLSQDGNLRVNGNQWLFSFYDQQNRVKQTGVFLNGTAGHTFSRTELSNYMKGTFTGGAYTGGLLPILRSMSYGHYDYLTSTVGHPPTPLDAEIYTWTFYDHYDHAYFLAANNSNAFTITLSFDPGKQNDLPANLLAIPPTRANNTMGQVTATATRVLQKPAGSSLQDWVTSVSYYDEHGQVIQSQQTTQAGHTDYVSSQYNFMGQLLASVEHHHNPDPLIGISMQNNTTTVQKYSYHAVTNRLQSLHSNINGQGDMPIVSNLYDDLGRLRSKNLGGTTVQQDLTYNLQGMLTAINPDWVQNAASNASNRYFGEVLHYDAGFSTPKYGGIIAGIIWRGAEKAKGQRAYGYEYDYAGRLLHAEFNEREKNTAGTAWDGNNWHKNKLDFTVSNLSYDANGNIQSLHRQGVDISPTAPNTSHIIEMDKLSYNYIQLNGVSTNRLQAVGDASSYATDGEVHDFIDGNTTPTDYTYDVNGNMTQDLNKDLQSISYTYLNMPKIITKGNGNTIEYVYDAAGTKLQKIVNDIASGISTTTHYINGHIYETQTGGGTPSGKLTYIIHPEGRLRPTKDAGGNDIYTYDYYVKDHLGNIRATVNAQLTSGLPYEPHQLHLHATHETANETVEEEVFDDIEGNVVSRPASTDPSNTAAVVLDGKDPEHRVATSLMLRVVAGDEFAVTTDAYYNTQTVNDPIDPSEMLQSIISALTNNNQGESAIEGMSMGDVINESFNHPAFLPAYNTLTQTVTNYSHPQAYINYLFFDDRMQFIPDASGMIQINTANQWHQLSTGATTPLKVERSGYLYVFHSVHDLSKVYFDDLDFTYYKGNLLEEDHYYPYGLQINALHTTAVPNHNPTRYGFNGQEKEDEIAGRSNITSAQFWQYDATLGRRWNLDPKPNNSISPYGTFANNPILFSDPLGDTTKYYNMSGDFLRQVNNEGNMTHIKVDQSLYTKFNLKNVNSNLSDNDYVTGLNASLDAYESSSLGPTKANVIARENGMKATYTGQASRTGKKDKLGRHRYMAEGTLTLDRTFDDGSSMEIGSWSAKSGPHGFGPTPNGNYSASRIVNTPESGMVRDGVGFKVYMTNHVSLNRTQLRIHPDQVPSEGTAGCIGLSCGATQLRLFRSEVRDYFRRFDGPFRVNVNVGGNPNYSRPRGGRQSSGE